jgi:hypothetical protein
MATILNEENGTGCSRCYRELRSPAIWRGGSILQKARYWEDDCGGWRIADGGERDEDSLSSMKNAGLVIDPYRTAISQSYQAFADCRAYDRHDRLCA